MSHVAERQIVWDVTLSLDVECLMFGRSAVPELWGQTVLFFNCLTHTMKAPHSQRTGHPTPQCRILEEFNVQNVCHA